MSRTRGFSLVELLVVIGIVAVLMSLLLPALSKARASSRQLQCASIMRQWGQAFHEYAAEYKGLIPHSGDRSRNPFGYVDQYCFAFPQRESCYTDALPPLMKRPRWSDYPSTEKPTGDIWQCPLAESLTDAAYGYLPSKHGFHSFAMNMYLNYDFDPTLQTKNLYPSFLNLAKAHKPSETLLMFETTLMPAAGYNQQPISITCLGGYYPDENARSFSDRHPHQKGKLGGNVMMLDGHVEWRESLWDDTLTDPTKPPTWNRLWWPY